MNVPSKSRPGSHTVGEFTSRPPWNLDETRSHVLRCFGAEQLELLEPSLASLHDRQFFAGYHYHEFRRLLHEGVDSKLPELHILQIMLPASSEALVSIATLRKHVAANVLACVQSLHALADTLAYAVAYACGLNLGPAAIAERRISLGAVATALNNRAGFGNVASILLNVKSHPDFEYLAALVNHSKHRSIVEPRLHVDATAKEHTPYALRFRGFNYDGRLFERRDVESLLEPLYSWLSYRIVDCGNELNLTLRPA